MRHRHSLQADHAVATGRLRTMAPTLRPHRILVPTDLSGGSVEALRYAVAFASEVDASVIVLHVVQLNIGGEELGIPRQRLLQQMEESARAQLRQLVDLLYRGEVPAQIVRTIRPDTVFVPYHWPGKKSANLLTNRVLDPISKIPEYKVCACRIERVG